MFSFPDINSLSLSKNDPQIYLRFHTLCSFLQIKELNFKKYVFSSPEPKAQVRFSDQILSDVHRHHCQLCTKHP